MTKLKWGVLGAAKIARTQVIPALQKSKRCEVYAIASRSADRAKEAAAELGIERPYDSYEAMLADPNIDVIYNPLPNHLHVKLSIAALEAGKHVLCEKPIGVSTSEATELIAARDRTGMKITEAFMVRHHPQWHRVLEHIRSGRIGSVTSVYGHFSYMNMDEENIRNRRDAAGGALMDIGCYLVMFSRLLYGSEPLSVQGLVERDPNFGTDRLTSAMLGFDTGHSIITCSTQQAPYQSVQITGEKGRIEVQIPVNTPGDRPAKLIIDDCSSLDRSGVTIEDVPAASHFSLQGDAFSKAVAGEGDIEFPLEDARANMAVIEAIFESAASGNRVAPKPG